MISDIYKILNKGSWRSLMLLKRLINRTGANYSSATININKIYHPMETSLLFQKMQLLNLSLKTQTL